jgi:hypothetical protein
MDVSYANLSDIIAHMIKPDGKTKETFISVPDDSDIDKFNISNDFRDLYSGLSHFEYGNNLNFSGEIDWQDRVNYCTPPHCIDDIVHHVYYSIADFPNVGLAVVNNSKLQILVKSNEIKIIDDVPKLM